MESKEMIEIRNIRNANSSRHIKMSLKERQKETQDILSWYESQIERPIKVTNSKEAKLA